MSKNKNLREFEEGIETNISERNNYGGYLCLDTLLSAQKPLSHPVHHDEMLFIIQHQTSELWLKLVVHELSAAIKHIKDDCLSQASKILARVKQVQKQLFEQWSVLETLTPSEYMEFRNVFGHASGFQSVQYRTVEFLLGNKNSHNLKVFPENSESRKYLEGVLNSPSLYDAFLMYLCRHGYSVPNECVQRDWSHPHVLNEGLVSVFVDVYLDPESHWDVYAICEQLVDVENSFQMWRFRHMKTVERIIGYKTGTGGSSGVGFLNKALKLTFFPELFRVRTAL